MPRTLVSGSRKTHGVDAGFVRLLRIGWCKRLLWPVFLSLLLAVTARGAETQVVPSLGLRQEYTDNLFTSSSNRLDTFVTHVIPGIRMSGRTELLSGSLAARLDALHYSANSVKDTVDQVYEGNGAYRLTPLLTFAGDATYRRESWPDSEVESNGQTLSTSSRRQNYGARAEYRIGELTTGSLDYRYEQIDYSRHDQFSDVTTHNVGAGIVYDAERLLSLLKLRSAIRYSKSTYETTQIENYELTVGGTRQINEIWSVSADAGGRYTRTEVQVATVALTQDSALYDAGWLFRTSLDYGGDTLKGSLAYSRALSNSSGRYGTAVERDIVTLSLRKQFSYELFALLGTGYYHSTSDMGQFGSQNTDETSVRASCSLRYEFNRNVALDLGYEYFHVENIGPDGTASRNKVFVQLTAQTNLFE